MYIGVIVVTSVLLGYCIGLWVGRKTAIRYDPATKVLTIKAPIPNMDTSAQYCITSEQE